MRISPLLLLFAAGYPGTCATRSLLLGDAERGSALFRSLNCIVCHSVNGAGGKSAPGLWRDQDRSFSPYEMTGILWNHAPAMWAAMERQGVAKPELNEQQAADLFVYFFATRLFEAPGNGKRGRRVFLDRRCGECHGIDSPVREGIRPVVEWDSLWDPIALAQEMWNHSHEMARALDRSKVVYPLLSVQEMSDLVVWLRSAQPNKHADGFSPVAPESGQALFVSKGCAGCHSGTRKLEARRTRYALDDFAAAMWNHALRAGPRQAPMSYEEMRRLVGYLVATQFFEERGNPENGERLFAKKRCSGCHDNPSSGAPGRSVMSGRMTSFGMVAALWKHGPAMLNAMRRQNIPWPRFRGSEMADVSAYLHGLQLKQRTSP
jgi:mono/diheme cytochrome c family protein